VSNPTHKELLRALDGPPDNYRGEYHLIPEKIIEPKFIRFGAYEIRDSYGDIYDFYKDQDRMLSDAYEIVQPYGLDAFKKWSFIVYDNDDAMHLLGYMGEQWFIRWVTGMRDLEFQLRLKANTDILGLQEYISLVNGQSIHFDTCDCPFDKLCPSRYTATIGGEVGLVRGYTRREALGRSYLSTREKQ
jgi:hypothetical protein